MVARTSSLVGGLVAIAVPVLAARAQSFQTLYSFTGGADAAYPAGNLLYHDGALFGATLGGGGVGQGAVFKLALGTGREKVLHGFAGGADGSDPVGGLISFGGAIYGATSGGGLFNCLGSGCGLVFRIDPASGAESTVYAFAGGVDGGWPAAGLTAFHGALYGTTYLFGATQGGYGTAFKLDPASGTETVLHQFGAGDGHDPMAALTGRGKYLYGTTYAGGNTGCAQEGCGTVFRIDAATGAEDLLHRFGKGNDGENPVAGLVAVGDSFYGTTSYGGRSAYYGTVFGLDVATGKERTLHSFGSGKGGGNPVAGLTLANGLLYGVTNDGGLFTKNCL
ncbi:MAG TPA: choice-of-anchor tandem repeat GloVer-containing protein, partial [Acetobacteraceae bacterium]|nr:choice-of-anchor tandem repeat GloVer-containing protein [Acetobacteraceae bacterium]